MEKPNVLVDPNAIIEQGVQIGNGTSVSAFSHIFDGVVIGNDCKLHDGVYIEKDVIISNRVIIHRMQFFPIIFSLKKCNIQKG
jgi:UDP-3-O-[3-hydroxymyristoyl] glucosamine N-acyltransferase